MNRIVLSTTCVLGAAAPLTAQEAETLENPNRFNLGPRIGFNFKANFRNHSQSNPGAPIGGIDHTYGDGYVKVDRSGNRGGRTWNWGYDEASQVTGGAIEFHSNQRSTLPFEVDGGEDEPQYGAELNYQRVFGTFLLGGRWGFEGGVSYTDLDLSDSRTASGTMTHVTDTYPLNGVVPPGAPYRGTFNGPGPTLGHNPTRTTLTEGATTTSHQELTGYAVGIRVGPFFEWNITEQFGVALSAGLAFAGTSVDYDFSEITRLQSGGTITPSGDSHKNDLLYGNYVRAVLRYDFSEHWGVYAGGDFQQLNELEQTAAGRTASLEQDATFFGVAGVSWRF